MSAPRFVYRLAAGLLGAALTLPLPAAASDGATHYTVQAGADATINLLEEGTRFGNHYYLVVNATPFNTESRFVVRFYDLNDRLDLPPYDANRVTRALLQIYEAPGYGAIGDQQMKVSVYRLADVTNWDESTVSRPGPRIAAGAPVATQEYEATGVGGWVTWDVTEHVRYWVQHPENNKGFMVAGRLVANKEPGGHGAITFESRDSTSPESAAGGAGQPPGHAPRLKVDVRPPLPRAVAPSPTVYTVATPTPTPAVEKSPKKTKGAFAERVPARAAPWWMSDFLARLLGYEHAGTRPGFRPSL